ncbi:AmmeMemoRadiSam system protein B, partial [Candidatus Bathyarchaeota archaeon]
VLGSDFDFVPICMMLQDFDVAVDVGQAIAKTLEDLKVNAVVIASSDLTHYEPQSSAEKKDEMVVEAIKKLDEKELFEVVEKYRISMCGVGPTVAMLVSSKKLGAKKGTLLKYATSGDITHDKSAVVGYCSMVVTKS